MTYVPHFPVTIAVPGGLNDIFSEKSAEGAIGQTFKFVDVDVVVKNACVHHGELYLTLEEVKADASNDPG